LVLNQDPAQGMGFLFKDRFTTNLLVQSFNQQMWRDENILNAFFFNKHSTDYYGIYLNSWTLVDKQTVLTSRFSNHAAGIKSIYNINDRIRVQPYVGYQRSENRSHIDMGWDLGLDADIGGIYLGDYRTNLFLTTEYDLYPERENYANQFNVQIHKQFSAKARDSLRVGYSKTKQQFYSGNSNDLVEVNIENKNLNNALEYFISSNSFLQLNTILMDRNISDNTPVNPNVRKVFRFENRLGYRYFAPKFLFYLGFDTFQETLDNLDFRTDSEALQSGIRTDFTFFLANTNRLDFQLNFIKFQYDTPDQINNHDDRDEIRFVGTARYFHRISPLLWMELDAYVNLFHKTYLYKEQSANNSWNRIYRVQATVNYKHNGWQNTLRTHVLTNYNVYDFDHLFKSTRSFVFRKYSISDSILMPLTYTLNIGFYGRLELEDRGGFYEDIFAQAISESSQATYFDIFLKKRNILYFNLEIGAALYNRKNWRHIPLKILSREIRRVSPYIRFVYPIGRNLRFYCQVSQNFLEDRGREKSSFTFGHLDLHYHW